MIFSMPAWQPRDTTLLLLPETVHLWRLWIPGAEPALTLLSPEERSQLNRLKLPRVAHRYAVSRWCQRYLLGLYLNQPPASLQFYIGAHGKPFLADRDLSFNLSHAGDWLVVAVAVAGDLGVDIEQIRQLSNLDGLIRRCLTETEQKKLFDGQGNQPEAQAALFLGYWTCKEAYLKATGMGLSQPMNQVPVQLSPPQFLPPCDRTFLTCFSPGAGYVGAIAALPLSEPPGYSSLRVEYYELSSS